MRDDDPSVRGPDRPAEDRLADRGRRVRVVVELAGVAIRQELASIVDQEQRRLAGDRRREHRRVVDGDDERVVAQPIPVHHLPFRGIRERGGGDDDVGRVRRLAHPIRRDGVRTGDPSRPAGGLGECLGPVRMAVDDGERHARAARSRAPRGGCRPGRPHR